MISHLQRRHAALGGQDLGRVQVGRHVPQEALPLVPPAAAGVLVQQREAPLEDAEDVPAPRTVDVDVDIHGMPWVVVAGSPGGRI